MLFRSEKQGRKSSGKNVDYVISDKDRGNKGVVMIRKLKGALCLFVSLFGIALHSDSVKCVKCGFGCRKPSRQDYAKYNDNQHTR